MTWNHLAVGREWWLLLIFGMYAGMRFMLHYAIDHRREIVMMFRGPIDRVMDIFSHPRTRADDLRENPTPPSTHEHVHFHDHGINHYHHVHRHRHDQDADNHAHSHRTDLPEHS